MPQTHAIHDSQSLIRQRLLEKIEMHRDSTRVGLQAAQRTSAFIEENDIDNLERQSGQRLSIKSFEERVQKIVPNIIFRTNYLTENQARFLHLNPGATTRRMIQILPDGKLIDLAGFQNQAMLPEYTIVLTRTKRIPAPVDQFKHIRAGDGSWVKVPYVNGKDIPQARETRLADGTKHFEFDQSKAAPGEQFIKEPAGTLVGWRTLLARLVGHKLVTPEEVEREFGRSQKASWAVRMGRRDIELPL